MVQSPYCHAHNWALLTLGILAGSLSGLFAIPSLAQITPDTTLGNEPSIVRSERTIRGLPGTLIEGGALRGRNLFQSFREFNVGDGQRVYFANPAGIDAILSRVTGTNPSRIFGLLGVDGSANLFLMNPNGIVFGPNARLDIAGSFVATTADRLTFENGATFSASNPEAPPMLTVTLRPHLPYGTNYQGAISHAGNLAVGTGQTLSLQGNTVTSRGSLSAPGGTVQLLGDRVALLESASIDVSHVGGGSTVLIGGELQGQGPVPNASQTIVTEGVTINADAIAAGDGGRVIVWADNDTQFTGQITARGGATGGNGGFVEVSGKQTLTFDGRVDTAAPQGKPGQLLLDPFDLEINQPLISAGQVILTADNNITFNAPVTITGLGEGLSAFAGNSIFVNSNLVTNGGTIELEARTGDIKVRSAELDTCPTRDCGTSAFITLDARNQIEVTDSLLLSRSSNDQGFDDGEVRAIGIVSREGSVLLNRTGISTTNNGTGDAGLIVVTALDTVEIRDSIGPDRLTLPGLFSRGNEGGIIIGGSPLLPTFPTPKTIRISNSRLNVDNDTEGSGVVTSGVVSMQALDTIEISNSSRISSSTFREGDAGGVLIRTGGAFSLSGDSRIFSNVEGRSDNGRVGRGTAGDIRVVAGSVGLDNSLMTSSNFGIGKAGTVVIRASGDVVLTNESQIFSEVGEGAVGDAGGIGIFARNLSIRNGSFLTAETLGQGDAGLVLVDVDRLISVTDNSGIFSTVSRTDLVQNAGTILLEARSIHVRNNSFIDVANAGTGVAGDIIIAARGVWLDNEGFIRASTRVGFGGNVVLNVPGAVILGRDSGIFASTLVSPFTDTQGGGNIAIGSGQLRSFSAAVGSTVFQGLEFDGSTLLVAGKTPRDNNILARGFEAVGGVIRINAFRLQDIAERPNVELTNDISTASFFRVDGLTVVNALNIFPSFRVDPLPDRTETPQISQGCDPRVRQESSQFTISGRGGLPPNAADGLNQSTLAPTPPTPTTSQAPESPRLVPARGWARNPDGRIQLVAQVTDPAGEIASPPLWYSPPCYAP